MDKAAVKNVLNLEDVLSGLLAEQRKLGALLDRQRAALSAGDAVQLSELCSEEQQAIERIRGLDRQRRELVEAISRCVMPGAETLPLTELAGHVPEPVRSRLLVRRAELVTVMTEVQRATAVVRKASESLLRHVGGLISTLTSAAQGGAAYSPSGRVSKAPVRLSTLNVTA